MDNINKSAGGGSMMHEAPLLKDGYAQFAEAIKHSSLIAG